MRPHAGRAIAGAVIGGVTGAIVAVNVVIFSGIDAGYEASIPEVLRENVVVGILTIAILMASPLVGAWIATRDRRPRHTPHPQP